MSREDPGFNRGVARHSLLCGQNKNISTILHLLSSVFFSSIYTPLNSKQFSMFLLVTQDPDPSKEGGGCKITFCLLTHQPDAFLLKVGSHVLTRITKMVLSFHFFF